MKAGRVQVKAEDVIDAPERIGASPFSNFLRYYRRKHPRMKMRRILREAPAQWSLLTKRQRNLFEKQRILARLARSPREKRLRVLRRRRNIGRIRSTHTK